jgi:hypothetical protein
MTLHMPAALQPWMTLAELGFFQHQSGHGLAV